jgi:hypothetical protein
MVEIVGLKLATHHPVIEPVSATRAGNGNLRCRHGCAKAAVLPAEIDPATRRGGKRGVSLDMRVKQPASIRRLPIPIGHDQRLYRISRVTAASRDGLIGRRFKLGGGWLSGSAGITVSH